MKYQQKLRIFSCWLAIVLLCSGWSVSVYAEDSATDTPGYQVTLSNSVTGVGKEVTLTVSLTNFHEQSEQIRGLQIDINQVDSGILTPISYTSLIEDPSAMSNTASYSEANSRLRLLYAKFSGTLPVNSDETGTMPVYQVTFKINESLETAGEIELPITVKMQTVNNRITLNSSCVIQYDLITSPVCSVDIRWTSMDFTYVEGDWCPDTHEYAEGTWQIADNEGTIHVENVGEVAVVASFSYVPSVGYEHMSGYYTYEQATVSSVTVGTGEGKTVRFLPTGVPTATMEKVKIGTITITIASAE